MPNRGFVAITAVMAATDFAPPSLAQGPPDYGMDWATIGDPRNRPTRRSEVPLSPELRIGRVAHNFRMTRTELTATQWLPFVEAFAPYFDGSPEDLGFTSAWIFPDGDGGFGIHEGYEQFPISVSWRTSARYANWLHNGQTNEAWAFESGAYDASTFTQNSDGTYNDQREHSPDARFWIPTVDEWVKAAHYDPNRYGQGAGGYWIHPGGSDEVLVSGFPWEGGQTNAGEGLWDWSLPQFPVGQYADISSPWGLLDISGGATGGEWSERSHPLSSGLRLSVGTGFRSATWAYSDRIESRTAGYGGPGALAGLRMAASVPSPAVVTVIALWIMIPSRRRL